MVLTEIRIAEFIKKERITFLEETDRKAVLQILIDNAAATGALSNTEKFFEAIITRENVVSTGIGMGIAIPHAKCDECEEFFISVGIHTKGGIDWDSIDGLDVKLIFLIGGPTMMHKEYLSLLSKLTTAIREESVRQNIIRSKSAEEVVKIFESCYSPERSKEV